MSLGDKLLKKVSEIKEVEENRIYKNRTEDDREKNFIFLMKDKGEIDLDIINKIKEKAIKNGEDLDIF